MFDSGVVRVNLYKTENKPQPEVSVWLLTVTNSSTASIDVSLFFFLIPFSTYIVTLSNCTILLKFIPQFFVNVMEFGIFGEGLKIFNNQKREYSVF